MEVGGCTMYRFSFSFSTGLTGEDERARQLQRNFSCVTMGYIYTAEKSKFDFVLIICSLNM